MADSLVWDLIVNDRGSASLVKFGATADDTSKRISGLVKAVAGVALVEAGKKAITAAGDFQQSTNVLVTAAGESAKNLDMVRVGIENVATTTGTKLSAVTDAMYEVEKAGYRGADGLDIVMAAAKGAREENADLATVVNATTSIMASYHVPASQAVTVTNELKTAAGESKTSMQLFAGSLSTVLPIAAANHISFAQVAGSLATLTSHGTTADEATQELATTIRGLAAPSQSAQKEMAQFGISANDVSEHLGSRGLSGTLDYLSETVLKRMGPSGVALLSTFNASKVAAADADREFSALPPKAQALAQAYENGTISLRDYRTGLKNLPSDQAALAAQFVATYNSAHGFQQALKDGVSGAQTYSAAIRTMTGGAVGLNTTLQLTGASAGTTAAKIDAIQVSAQDASGQVEGWASTQKLFNVQMDEMGEKVQVAGIKVGTVLIPYVEKAVTGLTDFVTWVSNSGTALDTVIAVIGGGMTLALGRYVVGLGVASVQTVISMARMAAAAVTGSAGYIAGLTGMSTAWIKTGTAAETGALRGMAANERLGESFGLLGLQAQAGATTVSAADDAIVAENEAAGEASSLAFGPVGLAVAAVGTALVVAAQHFGLFGGSAKDQVGPVDSLTSAIQADNDALGTNTRAQIANLLEKKGLFDAGLQLGISTSELTDAVMGNSLALQEVNAVLQVASLGSDEYRQNSWKLANGIGVLSGQLNSSQRAAENVASATHAASGAAAAAAGTTAAFGNSAQSAGNKASTAQSNVYGLAKSISSITKDPYLVRLGADVSDAQTKLSGIQSLLNVITGSHPVTTANVPGLLPSVGSAINITTSAQDSGGSSRVSGGSSRVWGGHFYAAGGTVSDGWSLVGEGGFELLHKSGPNVSIVPNPQAQAITGWSTVPGFAGGTRDVSALVAPTVNNYYLSLEVTGPVLGADITALANDIVRELSAQSDAGRVFNLRVQGR